jgi:P4 family phage/plasmid primase-like protien
VGHLKGICERTDVFAQTPLGIHVANGFLVIGDESMELQEFSPSHFSRNSSPIAFDPKARCPVFLDKVLRPALDEDDISLLQYYAGQCLLGRNLTQTVLILHGEGGTGKGTTSNVIQKLVGVHNCQELRTEHLEERFELYRYIGRSLLYGADVDPGFLRTKGAHTLKRIVGNDLLTPEGKNSNEVFNIRGNFNVLITCNNRLSVRLSGDVKAWRRRLQIIEFHKADGNTPIIRELDNWLIEHEGPGILNWAIVGASEVLADSKAGRARELSAAQTQRLEALLGMSDSIRGFLQAKVERRDGECLEKNELLEAYADYCGDQKWDPLPEMAARKELNNRMLEMFGSVERKSAGPERNQRGYSNVAFIEQNSDYEQNLL